MKQMIWAVLWGTFAVIASHALAEQTLTIKDYTGRGFAPDLVNYSIKINPRDVPKLRLVDSTGQPVVYQVSKPDKEGRATLSFVTGLPTNGTVAFTVSRDGKGPLGTSSLKTRADGNALVMANALMAVKVPKPIDKKFQQPVAAHTLPAPILAFRCGQTGAWLGQGRILSPRLVKAWRLTQTASGPVYAEVRYELDYDGGGYYRAVIRVTNQVPVVIVTEQYDLGKMADQEQWELSLTQGWKPDTVEVAKTWGNGGVDRGRTVPLAQFQPQPIMSDGAYGNAMSQVGLFRADETVAAPDTAVRAGVVPLHRGYWRRAATLDVLKQGASGVAVRFPMVRTKPRWVETSPFCVATHQQDLPYTFARRMWGLVLGRPPVDIPGGNGDAKVGPFYQARLTYGVVGLDRYKDFVLDWPDARPSYPRSFMRSHELPRYRQALKDTTNPLTKLLTNAYEVFDGIGATTQPNLPRAVQGINHVIKTAICSPAQSHHASCDAQTHIARADDALAWPGLEPEQRRDLRARLALLAYLFTDPDTTSQGTGGHTGNPNMSMARQMWVSGAIALLPDHPMYAAWRDYMAEFTEFKFSDNMTPGGGWFEPGTYQLWAYARMMCGLLALESMKAPGIDRLFMYHQANMDYYMNLLTPFDSRYGARMIPGFGNSAAHYSGQLIEAAGCLAYKNPDQASQLTWAWRENGCQGDFLRAAAKPWIPPKRPKLTSRYFPGFGVIFRAHQGPDETYLMLRSGYLWSHWNVDQGNVVLYSKGAALLPSQPYTYFDSKFRGFSQYNDIRFGHPENEFRYGWPDSNVLDYGFGKRAQYAWASAGYPAWFINPGISPGYGDPPKLKVGVEQKEGAFWWNRQVAFMVGKTPRSPNYFVFHDTVTGAGRLAQWFNLDVVGRKRNVRLQGNRMTIQTEWPTSLELTFADGAPRRAEMTEENQILNLQYNVYGPTYAAATGDKPVSPNWFRKDGTPVERDKLKVPDQERRVLVQMAGEPGRDYLWIAYPKGDGEAAPSVERLAAHVVKVTHSEGTDFILLSPTYERFEGQDVVLEGRAAAVRVAPRSVTFCLLADAGRVGYRGHVFEGLGPFEQTLDSNRSKAGAQTVRPDRAATIVCRPQLKDHQEIVPGVRKATDGNTVEYLVDSPVPLKVADGDVQIEARKALVCIGPDGTRFVVADSTYAMLAAGTRGVRGVGPFDLTVTPTHISGTVDGRLRTIVVSKPDQIIRPMFRLDGVRWYAAYPDDPAPYRGRSDVQFSMAFGVTNGRHSVEITEWESPPLPPAPPQRAVAF